MVRYGWFTESPFRLDAVSSSEYKLLTTATLDREVIPSYSLTLTCVDLGSPPLTGTADLQVFVLDQNDHDPVFVDGSTVRAVRQAEGNPVGAVITRVSASDQDEGLNAQLRYSIQPVDGTPDGVVDIAESGDVVARTTLDYETQREYRYYQSFNIYLYYAARRQHRKLYIKRQNAKARKN